MRMMRVIGAVVVLVGSLGIAVAAADAGDALSDAKSLYTAASYEEALKVLRLVETPEAFEYKGLCLLALGRQREAEQAVEQLVLADAGYALVGDERPPRFVALFTATRKRVLPGALRTMFADARARYQAKDLAAAKTQFDRLLTLTDDPTMREVPEIADLRLLAQAFAELSAVPPAAPEAGTTKPAPAAAAATAASAEREVPIRVPRVVPARALEQRMPPVPKAIQGRALSGVLKVEIAADGRVTAATLATPVHPGYDRMLLVAASAWRYAPATLDGRAVPSERLVQIRIDTP